MVVVQLVIEMKVQQRGRDVSAVGTIDFANSLAVDPAAKSITKELSRDVDCQLIHSIGLRQKRLHDQEYWNERVVE